MAAISFTRTELHPFRRNTSHPCATIACELCVAQALNMFIHFDSYSSESPLYCHGEQSIDLRLARGTLPNAHATT
eukprot:m.291796 g.291796  ORF g.291796 m.291796 type:complete len:75 (+) comp19985_c0_seq6:67-291(+)